MKRRIHVLRLSAGILLMTAAVVVAFGQGTSFSAANYYIFPLQETAADLEALSLAVQADGFSVVRYEDNSAIAYEDGLISSMPVSEVLGASRLLVLDGARFLLRVSETDYTYALRPSSLGYELVFSPNGDLGLDALVDVLFELQSLGVIGSDVDFGYTSFVRDALKGPAPSAEMRIDSDLYGLMVAEDWFTFAASKGMTLIGLRVEVVAEIAEETLIPVEYYAYVTRESGSLVELLLPIEKLGALASSADVVLVRQAYQPVAP